MDGNPSPAINSRDPKVVDTGEQPGWEDRGDREGDKDSGFAHLPAGS